MHVHLDLECLDCIYLNAYVPNFQVPGQVSLVISGHLGCPIPSSAIMSKMGDRFRAAVVAFAEGNGIPVLRLKAEHHQIDIVRPLWQKAAGPGVVAIGIAQEFPKRFTGRQSPTRDLNAKMFFFDKRDRPVSVYYFYLLDDHFGPGVHQDLLLFSLSSQGVGQRPRVGQTSSRQGWAGLCRVG